MSETKQSLAADIGWLRLAIKWADTQPIHHVDLGGPVFEREMERARGRFIARLKDQERFKVGLMEKMR